MISLLEIASELFGYDPDTTPQLRLEDARMQLRTALAELRCIQRKLAELSDDSVYDCSTEWPIKRTIHKITPKKIILEPRFRGDKREHLPRQALEDGNRVKPRTWPSPSFAFGHVLRAEHESQLSEARKMVHDCCEKIRQLQRAMDNGEHIRIARELRRLENDWQNTMQQSQKPKSESRFDWKTEGF